MQPSISAHDYVAADVFAAEQATLFTDVWQFVAFTDDLAQPNDFVVARIGGRSVVVQNFDGALRAYANVCSHRFSRIRCDARGNGPLRCPYHGWIYNADGVPYSIPSRPRFDDLSKPVIDSLRLTPFDVEACGRLVFARAHGDGPTLRAYLGAAFETIEQMTAGVGELIDRNEMTIRANWKINVENTLESYHVAFVHANTFKKVGARGLDFRFDGPHSSWLAPVDEGIAAQMQKLIGMMEPRTFAVDGYFHQLVFPNLTLATTFGTSLAVQQFFPVSPTETRFTSYVFQGRFNADVARKPAFAELMNRSVSDFNRSVFEEDRVVCEQVQLGAAEATKPGILSDEEERVSRFQAAYVAAMRR